MKNKKAKLRSKADKLFYEVCLKRNPYCLLCGKKANQVHHFKPKSLYGHLRYEYLNAISLCFSCHFKLTHQDKSLSAKIAWKKGNDWYKKIEALAKNRPTSYQTTKWYEDNIKKLENILKYNYD